MLDLLRNFIRLLKSPFRSQAPRSSSANLFKLASSLRPGQLRWPWSLASKSSIFSDEASCARGLLIRLLFLFSIVLTSLSALEEPLLSTVEDEIARIDHLIAATEEKIRLQKELRELMLRLQMQEEQFFQGDQSKAHAKKMVDSASQILELIKRSHLEHLFSSTYMEELALFSSIAGKTAPARP